MRRFFMKTVLVRSASPPPGVHTMRIADIEAITNAWGNDALRFHFAGTEGPAAGSEISRTTSSEAKLGNSLGNFLAELLGRPLGPGELIDLDPLVGESFEVEVESLPSSNGGSQSFQRIKGVCPLPQQTHFN